MKKKIYGRKAEPKAEMAPLTEGEGVSTSVANTTEDRNPVLALGAIFILLMGLVELSRLFWDTSPPASWEDPEWIGCGRVLRFWASVGIALIMLKVSGFSYQTKRAER